MSLVIEKLPKNTRLEVVDHGQDNLVIIAGDFVYRFPRSEAVWQRASLEHFVLQQLRNYPELPVPQLQRVSETPAYIVAKTLPGSILEPLSIRSLAHDVQRHIGEQIGTFAATFHSLFQPTDIRPLLNEPNPQHWYATYLKNVLESAQGTAYSDLAQWVVNEWPHHDHSETTVIHDDLHPHNLLFNDQYVLTGVLDFADVNLGNPEQDLRYTYWMGDIILGAAADAYERCAGRAIDRELIELCAVSQELSGLYDPRRAYMHERARANLQRRFSFNLPELQRDKKEKGVVI